MGLVMVKLPEPIPFAEMCERLIALPPVAGRTPPERSPASTPNALASFLARTVPATTRRSTRR